MPLSPDRILYIDDSLLAVNKLSGELVVRGKGAMGKLPMFDFLKKDYPELRMLHRLDFETSGVVLFARSRAVERAVIDSKFTGWNKVYQTLVAGRIQRDRSSIRFPLPARGKGTVPADSQYRVLDRFAHSSYIEVQIETGRHHQIRRHLAMIHHPLVLDTVYGNTKFNQLFTRELGYRKFFLHAARLEVPHPVSGKKITIKADLPMVFEQMLKILREL